MQKITFQESQGLNQERVIYRGKYRPTIDKPKGFKGSNKKKERKTAVFRKNH